jgi:hypothetical protein
MERLTELYPVASKRNFFPDALQVQMREGPLGFHHGYVTLDVHTETEVHVPSSRGHQSEATSTFLLG